MNLSKALEIMNSGEPFLCEYVTCDVKRGTGGNLKKETLVISGKHRKPTGGTPTKPGTQNHYDNSTRNCLVVLDGLVTSVVRTVHLVLILSINNEKLML